MHKEEILKVGDRTFILIPEEPLEPDSAWTFLEEVNGSRIVPDDLMQAHTPKGFLIFHIKSQLLEPRYISTEV